MFVHVFNDRAILPKRASEGAAGYDLYSCIDTVVKPGKMCTVDTGVGIVLSQHSYGRIAPRSGLAKKGIDVMGGVVDCDYRGEMKVMLINFGNEDLVIKVGDRIAQLIVTRIFTPMLELKEGLLWDYEATERGSRGFGSTGI